MKLKNVQIELNTTEIQQALAIGLDENAADALAFIKDILCKRIEKALGDRKSFLLCIKENITSYLPNGHLGYEQLLHSRQNAPCPIRERSARVMGTPASRRGSRISKLVVLKYRAQAGTPIT